MDIPVSAGGELCWPHRRARCALGRGGVSDNKREGDGATPAGCFALRSVIYRADRVGKPATGLPVRALGPNDGWCDDAADPRYNRPVTLPDAAGHEVLWRDDHIYDVIVELAYNDDPVVAGRGSAIFLHVARPGYAATEGCVALALADLLALLAECGPGDRLCVSRAGD